MTGTNSSNDRLILRQNVEINSNWYFSYDVFSGMKSSTTWNGNAIVQSPKKMSWVQRYFNTSVIRFLMVYRTIIDVILHLFIICNDLRCQFPFFSQTFRHNGSAVFGTMPPMCRSCPDVNKLWGMDTTILGQHRPFMSIKIVCTTQRVTKDGVPMLANPFNWRVRWPRPARVPLFSLGLKVPLSPCGHSGRLVNSLSPTWG